MSHNQHLTCRLKPVLLSLLLIVHLKGFGEALQVQTKDNVVHHLPNDRAVMHSTLLGDLVHVLGDYSDSCISPLVDIDPDAFTDLVRYMKEVHNEVEDASEWIRNELGARSPSQTTRVLEAANYLVMPLFIVAFGVTIQVPGTGETALQIGTLRPPTPNLAPGHQCAICHESDEGAATRLDCAHCFHTICIFSWLYRDSTCPLCRYDVTFQSIVKLAGDEWVIPKAYVAGVLSQWLMPSY